MEELRCGRLGTLAKGFDAAIRAAVLLLKDESGETGANIATSGTAGWLVRCTDEEGNLLGGSWINGLTLTSSSRTPRNRPSHYVSLYRPGRRTLFAVFVCEHSESRCCDNDRSG